MSDDQRLVVPTAVVEPTGDHVGRQTPSNFTAPLWHTTAGDDAVDLAAVCGLNLFPWQQLVLRNALGERTDGRWSAFEVGLLVPRQNGKNIVALARQLAGLFLFDEEQQVHTAHRFKTAKAAYRDLRKLIEGVPDLMNDVKALPDSSDQTAVILKNGNRIDFLARASGGGRGLSGDTVYLDEAYHLDPVIVSDLLPTLSARPSPQLWYMSSTGFEYSEVLRELRQRAIAGDPEARAHLAYFEWTAEHVVKAGTGYDTVDAVVESNPSLGYVQSWDWIQAVDLRGMTEDSYKRERLGMWSDNNADRAIPADVWEHTTGTSELRHSGRVVRRSVGVDVTRDRDFAVIAGASQLSTGVVLVDIIAAKPGVSWVADMCKTLHRKHRPVGGIVIDSFGGGASLTHALTERRVPFTLASTKDITTGTANLYDGLTRVNSDGDLDPTVYHGTNPYLDDAANTARRRLVGQSKTAWTWREASDDVPVTPLRAVTLAFEGLNMVAKNKKRQGLIA